MKNFKAAQALFKDSIDISTYFDSISAELVRKQLLESIGNEMIPLICLLGEPGVGKSHLLHMAYNVIAQPTVKVWINHPFFTAKELFIALYEGLNLILDPHKTEDEALYELSELYRDRSCIIFIDEAQLIQDEQVELIDLLCHLKHFQFILAMHKEEGKKLLQLKRLSLHHQLLIECERLSESEILRYLQSLFMSRSLGDIALMFTKREIKTIANYTRGNFRTMKKYFFVLMDILDYAHTSNLPKYQTLNHALLTMAALDTGLINDA